MEPLRESDPRDIAGYQLVGRLGQGGMGVVYLGSKKSHNYAIKVMKPSTEDTDTGAVRFAREIGALEAVSHPRVAKVHESGLWDGRAWFATEFINGPDLGALVAENGPLNLEEWRQLASGLLDGLAAIHDQGIIHRDIKPSNIIVTPEGPKIIDFGVAHVGDETSVTQTGLLPGSPAWFSPEQIEGLDLTPATDVFSAASTLVFAASGESPWGPQTSITAASVLKLLTHEPRLDGLSDYQRNIVAPLLDKNPVSRLASVDTVRRGLQGAVIPTAVTPRPGQASPTTPPITQATQSTVTTARQPSAWARIDQATKTKYLTFAAVIAVAVLVIVVGVRVSANRHIPPTVSEATQMLRTAISELNRSAENPLTYIRAVEQTSFPGYLDTESPSWQNTVAFMNRLITWDSGVRFHTTAVEWSLVESADNYTAPATACSKDIRPGRTRGVDVFSATDLTSGEVLHFAVQEGKAFLFPTLCDIGDDTRLQEANRQAADHFSELFAAMGADQPDPYLSLIRDSLYPEIYATDSEAWVRGEDYVRRVWSGYRLSDLGQPDLSSSGIWPVTLKSDNDDCSPRPLQHENALWVFREFEDGEVSPFFFLEFDRTWHPAWALCRLGR